MMRENAETLTQSINLAYEAIFDLQKVINTQADAITSLRATIETMSSRPPPNLARITPQHTATNSKGKNQAQNTNPPKKSFASVAKELNAGNSTGDFTLVKKKIAAPLFQREYTHLNRQVVVETDGPIPDGINDDNSLASVNKAIAHHKL